MTEIVSFPGLGLEFEISRVAFMLGSRPVYWYGVIIALAFLCGTIYVLRRADAFGLDGDSVMDVVLGAVVLGIVGARLYYVAFQWATYSRDPMKIFYVWEGGLAVYGSVIGGVLGVLLMCRIRKVRVLPVLDLILTGMILGQAIGRWGNFFNMEAFGNNTDALWGMTSPSITMFLKQNIAQLSQLGVAVDVAAPVHPTFFYESMWCLAGFLLLAFYTKYRRYDGELALMYLGWYGLGRFFIEGLRTDSLLIGTLRVSQVLALVCVVMSVIALLTVRSRIRRSNDPDYLPLYVNTDESREALEAIFKRSIEKAAKEKAAKEKKPDEQPAEEPADEPVGDDATGVPSSETEEQPTDDPVEDDAPGVPSPETEEQLADEPEKSAE